MGRPGAKYKRRKPPDKNTREWGFFMHAAAGGLAAQKKYREEGRDPAAIARLYRWPMRPAKPAVIRHLDLE